MKYLVCFMWNNLRANHAGFPHICRLLQEKFPSDYTVIMDYVRGKMSYMANPFFNRCINYLDRRYHASVYHNAIKRMMDRLRDDDEVFLLEYLHKEANQIELAKVIRETSPKVKIFGLAHLTPSAMENSFMQNEYAQWTQPIDAYLTLGSSLTTFLLDKTNHSVPVYTLFHPVDNAYFYPLEVEKKGVTVIALGNLQRNYVLLEEVVKRMPNVKFVLCAGYSDFSSFKKYPNATVLGYMPESELRLQLSKADISLNVMDDTVGSNAITISMAMHLAMVVSDVGSIRDYCNEDNTFFCREVDDYVRAISFLSEDAVALDKYKSASAKRAGELSVERFNELVNSISA